MSGHARAFQRRIVAPLSFVLSALHVIWSFIVLTWPSFRESFIAVSTNTTNALDSTYVNPQFRSSRSPSWASLNSESRSLAGLLRMSGTVEQCLHCPFQYWLNHLRSSWVAIICKEKWITALVSFVLLWTLISLSSLSLPLLELSLYSWVQGEEEAMCSHALVSVNQTMNHHAWSVPAFNGLYKKFFYRKKRQRGSCELGRFSWKGKLCSMSMWRGQTPRWLCDHLERQARSEMRRRHNYIEFERVMVREATRMFH